MKKYFWAALCVLMVQGMVFAATSGSVQMSGTIISAFSLEVPAAFAGTMDDTKANEWSLGDVKVISNQKNWTLSLSSANSGYLVLQKDIGLDMAERVQYKVLLKDLMKDPVALDATWVSGTQPRTLKTGNSYGMSILFGPSTSFWQAGTYVDTITVTITAEGTPPVIPPPGGIGGGGDTLPVEPPGGGLS
ncbi:MAG: hypothetical protein N3A02_06260 [Rectinema sp.]|nr:hypothetical protein [Rectinema sp.]